MNDVLHHWTEKYKADGLVFGTTPNNFLVTQAKQLKTGDQILAVGDGEGRNGIWLARQGHYVTSVDGAITGSQKAQQQAQDHGLEDYFQTECVDLLEWQWPKHSFDAVACLHLYFMPDDRKRMHTAMIDALKPGGLIILECFHPDNVGRGLGGPKIPELCYRASDLKDDFANAHILFLEETERESAPSNFHDGGRVKVTQLVART